MARRILKRVLGAIGVLWAAASFTFLAETLLPGNRAVLLLNQQTGQQNHSYSASLTKPINKQYGFDNSVPHQYLDYIWGFLPGNLGPSSTQHQPVLTIIARQVGPTLVLTATALVFAWLLALLLTVTTARRGRFLSGLGSGIEVVTATLPYYWLGVILLVVFAIDLHAFPVLGGTGLM